MAGSMATTSNAAMRKKTPFYVSIFMFHDTSVVRVTASPREMGWRVCDQRPENTRNDYQAEKLPEIEQGKDGCDSGTSLAPAGAQLFMPNR